MNCEECEIALGMAESGVEVEIHLLACRACSELAMEMRVNAEALESMRLERFAQLRVRAKQPLLPAFIAAAAAIVLAILTGIHFREQTLPPVHYAMAPMKFKIPKLAPPPPHIAKKRVRPAAPLIVKMLTADPKVVIYWQIDGEREGMER
jgi:hypothetical protein